MAYQSKYTGLQIDDILDSVEWKQGKIEDLASIRAGAQKGATALQSYTEKYTGTVTGIKINGETKSGSGVIDLGTISTPTKISQLENDSNFISSDNLKTINGESIVGSGDITIQGGETLTESDITAMGFTKNTGTYSKPSGGIPKTDLASAVQTSLGKADTAIQSTSFGELTDLALVKGFESVQNGTVYALPDCDTGDEDDILLSRSSVKTINGQSIVGSGDITISGGSGGGEDIRYFTDFTVEDFIEACEIRNLITENTTELFNAMKSNKIICVPYRGYDKGFIVASYKSGEDVNYPEVYLQSGGEEYYALTNDDNCLTGEYPVYNNLKVIEVEEYLEEGEIILEFQDNRLYKITEPVNTIIAAISGIQKSSTIRFVSGNSGTTIELIANGIFWANGEMPSIEPNMWYELSIANAINEEALAVLTPFKAVE